MPLSEMKLTLALPPRPLDASHDFPHTDGPHKEAAHDVPREDVAHNVPCANVPLADVAHNGMPRCKDLAITREAVIVAALHSLSEVGCKPSPHATSRSLEAVHLPFGLDPHFAPPVVSGHFGDSHASLESTPLFFRLLEKAVLLEVLKGEQTLPL